MNDRELVTLLRVSRSEVTEEGDYKGQLSFLSYPADICSAGDDLVVFVEVDSF